MPVKGLPSTEYMYGAVPPETVPSVKVPLLLPHDASVTVVTIPPGGMGAILTVMDVIFDKQPLAFFAVRVCMPGATVYPPGGYVLNTPLSTLNVNPLVADVISIVPFGIVQVG